MVSRGDTKISLHIQSPRITGLRGVGVGVFWSQNWKYSKICLNFNFVEGGYSGVKTENTQRAKICLNLNFPGGRGYSGVKNWKYSKCQDRPKFQFSGGGGALVWNSERGSLENLDTNLLFEVSVQKPALCITDSLSHTTYKHITYNI